MSPRRGPDAAGTIIVHDGVIVYASEGVAALAGRSVPDIVGRSYLELVVPEEREAIRARHEARLRGEAVDARKEFTIALPDGTVRRVEAHASRDGRDVLVHLRDLSGREARRLRLDAVAALGAALQRELTEEAIHARVREGLSALGLASALLRMETGGVRIVWASAPPALGESFSAITGSPLDGYLGCPNSFSTTVARDGYAYSDDWGRDASGIVPEALAEALRQAVETSGGTQAIGVRLDERDGGSRALVVAGDWLGSDDAPAVRLFGSQVSAAFDAARTIADLSRRNEELAALARVAELASEATDLSTLFARASDVVRPVAGYAGCAIFVADEASGSLVRVYAEGGTTELDSLSTRIPLSSPLGDVLRDRSARVVEVPFAGGDPGFMAAMDFRSLAWVPLVARSRSIGLLTAGFHGGAEVARGSLDLLSAVAAHFGSAIESHGLLSDLRRRVGELTLVVDVARAAAQLDPVLLLEAALRRVCETPGAEFAAAYLVEGNRLVLLSSVGLEHGRALAVAQLQPGEGAPGLAIARRAVVRARAGEVFGVGRRDGPPVGEGIAVPLLAKANAVGALVLGRAEGAPFTEGDAALLSSIGVQLGLAVDAARLFADVRRRLSDLEAVHALTLRVFANAPGDAGALLHDACRELVRALSARSAAVFLAPGAGAPLRLAASVGPPPAAEAPEGLAFDLTADDLSAEVMRTGIPVQTEDVTRDPRSVLRGRADLPPFSVLALPLASRREVRGLVFVADAPGRRFTSSDLAVASALASALGVGVENAELYAEATRRVEELSVLNEAGRTIAASLDLGEVLHEAAAAARRLVGSRRAYVVLQDAATGELSFGAGAGTEDAPLPGLEGPVPPGTVIERVLRLRRPGSEEDVAGSAAAGIYRLRLGARALAAAPILVRGEPVGVLVADEPAPRRFSEPDLQRLTTIADRLAAAMENARLYAETRRRAEQLGLLHEVGRSLVTTLDIEQILSDGIRNLARIVDAPAAYLALVAGDGEALEVRAASGEARDRLGARVALEPPAALLAPLVFRLREPVLVADALADPRVADEPPARTPVRAYLGLPLVVRERVIGTAIIVETGGRRLFTPAEVERAAAIANQLAVAADNARLYEDLRRSYGQLARAQQQLVQGERLAALGELSAVVAHEVRNPLAVIFNSIGSLRRLVRPAGDAKTLFDILEEEAERLNRIVGDLLDFARPSTPELRPDALARVVEDAVGAAVLQQAGLIEIVRELDPALPPVAIDARLVRQALLNVAVNAVQAMPRGGRITIRTRRDAGSAIVEIEDTGAGIPEEVRERMFEPFFTTKASGTGLGLAVVRRIVEGHGGAVHVRTVPGSGSVFALEFPLGEPPVENGPAMR